MAGVSGICTFAVTYCATLFICQSGWAGALRRLGRPALECRGGLFVDLAEGAVGVGGNLQDRLPPIRKGIRSSAVAMLERGGRESDACGGTVGVRGKLPDRLPSVRKGIRPSAVPCG